MDELWLLVLAVVAIIFAVPYALAVLLFTFPFFTFWLLLAPARTIAEPQLVIDASSHPELARLRAEKRETEKKWDEVRHSGCGIRWSDNLNRFEERSVRGRELNEQLYHWDVEFYRIETEIYQISIPETELVTEWRNTLLDWSQKQDGIAAKHAGWKLALLVFVTVWIAVELIGMAFPGFIEFFAFAWNPSPGFLHPGIAIGAAAGWAAGIYRVSYPPGSFARQAQLKIEEYENAKETREQSEDKEIEGSRREELFEEKYDSSDEDDHEEKEHEQKDPWYEVLGLSSDANEREINSAYREKIKQYHPDRVSGLGEKLIHLANIETQKLNAARDEGLSLRR